MARPSKFKPEFIEQAKNYVSLGATDEQMASFFSVAVSTFYLWKAEHPEFSEALKLSKEEYDSRIEISLAERAMGYSHPEDKIFFKDGEVTTVSTTKHYPPDTTAAIFWLKNRKSAEWKDVKERVDTHRVEDGDTNMIELARRIAYLFQEGLDASQTQH
jgi:hypothetical protein